MRKHCHRRPVSQLVNPLMYVLEGQAPLASHKDQVRVLKLKNHAAMNALVRGEATTDDMDKLISMSNITAALAELSAEIKPTARAGCDALFTVATRGYESHRFIVWSEEWHALNALLDLHDALMDTITVLELEQANRVVLAKRRNGALMKLTGEMK